MSFITPLLPWKHDILHFLMLISLVSSFHVANILTAQAAFCVLLLDKLSPASLQLGQTNFLTH